MRKIIYAFALILGAVACTDQNTTADQIDFTDLTTVSVGTTGDLNPAVATKAATTEEAQAWFFIRIDGRIPEAVGVYNTADYFPQTSAKKSVFKYNYGTLNTNSEDYRYISGVSNGVNKYIYDTYGIGTETVILDQPSFKDLFESNEKTMSFDTTDLKILWYIVKFQTADNRWHVDGVLTSKSTKSILEIPGMEDLLDNEYEQYHNEADDATKLPGEVEVDIHQQEHSTWNEIKTSIHVRDTVNTQVEIPLPANILAAADDMVVRVFTGYYAVEGNTFDVDVKVIHETDKLVINVSNVSAELLKALREQYGDGITVEVHTYNNNDNAEAWEALKQSEVFTYPDSTTIIKHISSALYK
ncbi:MAG: hypothetical protein K5984_02050 [Bacteroidales bacterium]|nr:hypothetical protein [Bacteroidales bacterium]